MKKSVALTKWFSFLLIAVWLGLLALCLFISIYTGNVMRKQAVEANENLLSVYLEKIDSNVSGITRFLSQFASSNYSVSVMARTEDLTEHYLAMQDVLRQLKNTSFMYNTFNGIFVYSKNKTIDDRFLCQLSDGTGLVQQEDIRSYISTHKDIPSNEGWQLINCEGRAYLFSMVKTGDTYCGAWLAPEKALNPLKELQLGENGSVLMQDASGKSLATTNLLLTQDEILSENSGSLIKIGAERFLQVTRPAEGLPVYMTVLVPESFFAGKVRLTQGVIVLLFAVVLAVLALMWLKINKAVAQPVKMLTQVMQCIGKGDLQTKADINSRFNEFKTIAVSLNSMTEKIIALQQDVYLRILNEQKTRVQYLQMQIRPHFFLNALNVIYSFSLTKQNDLIEQLTLCLSEYFRYMFKCESSLVPLGAELEHINNYMEILRLRSQGKFDYICEIDRALNEAQIPPLTVQPFIENSVKHGGIGVHGSEISLTVECRPQNGEQCLYITVRDNGEGYPEKVLELWRTGEALSLDVTQKIGIVNVRKRLELMYGDKAGIYLSNSPDGGAISKIVLPLNWQEEVHNDDITG